MFIQFLNLLATIISVISLLIVTYGALIAFIAFIINELKRFTGKYTSDQYPETTGYFRDLPTLRS